MIAVLVKDKFCNRATAIFHECNLGVDDFIEKLRFGFRVNLNFRLAGRLCKYFPAVEADFNDKTGCQTVFSGIGFQDVLTDFYLFGKFRNFIANFIADFFSRDARRSDKE